MSFWKKKPPTPPVDWRVRAGRLPSMFVADTEFPGERDPIFVTPKPIGVLQVPSGRIVTGDPIATLDFAPFTRQAPTGNFPIELSLAELSPDQSRIAAARIVFSQQPVASWEVATGGTGATAPAPNGASGYSGARAIFMDAQTVPLFQAFVDACERAEWWYDVPKSEGAQWEHACFEPDPRRPENCATFSTGSSDGIFVSYWGLDARGEIATLVTDFLVIP